MKRIASAMLTVCLLTAGLLPTQAQEARLRVMSYNVENLMDCRNDSLTDDDEYAVGGIRGWTPERYRTKLLRIAQVIAAVGEWDKPLLAGLCEIENRRCMEDLAHGPLGAYGYAYVHHESPDRRGIEVALLYDPKRFEVLTHRALPVRFETEPHTTTRDILYVKGAVERDDTLHVYVCHFPSRSNGTKETEHRRMAAAGTLRAHLDSVQRADGTAAAIIMGDMNDTPPDRSLSEGLRATGTTRPASHELTNLMYGQEGRPAGTHKHRGEWSCFDHIIVTGTLLDSTRQLYTRPSDARVFRADFLLEPDEKGLGVRPKRTYHGMRYTGGYSDHLPVYTDLHLRKRP